MSIGLLAIILVGFGLNGWGWFLLISPTLKNSIFLKSITSHGVWGYLPHIVLSRWEGTMGFTATKFLVANSFSLGLASITAAIYTLFKYFCQPSIKNLTLLVLSLVLSAHLNLIAAGLFFIGCFSYFLFQLVSSILKNHEHKTELWGLVALLIALILTIPYIYSISSFSSSNTLYFSWPDLNKIRILVIILLPLWLLAGITLCSITIKTNKTENSFLIISILLLSSAFLFLNLIKQNEFKIPFLIAILLSLFIGINACNFHRRIFITAWIIGLSALPTTLLGLIAYTSETKPSPTSPQEDAVYNWIRNNTDTNSVIIAERNNNLIPLLADRDAYLAYYSFLKSSPHNRDYIKTRAEKWGRLWRETGNRKLLKSISNEISRPIIFISYQPKMLFSHGIKQINSFDGIKLWYMPYPYTGHYTRK